MIKLAVKVNQPRVKADSTGTISVSTLIELNKEVYDWLSEMYFDKEEVVIYMCKSEEELTLIQTAAENLLKESNNESN